MISKNDVLNAKILIVDDDPLILKVITRILRSAGYTTISSTSDSREVLTLYNNYKPDLLMLDICMPNIDGYEVLKSLTRIYHDDYIPALVVTAMLDGETRLKALKVGAKDFLTKPFDPLEVITRIHNIIEVRLLHNEVKRQKHLLEQEHLEAEEIGKSLLSSKSFDERINASVIVSPCSNAGGDRAGFMTESGNGTGLTKEWLAVFDASGHGMGAAKFQEVALGGLLAMVSSGIDLKNALVTSNKLMENLGTERFLVGNIWRVMRRDEKEPPDGEVWIEELNLGQHPVLALESGRDEVDEWKWDRANGDGATLPLGVIEGGLDTIASRCKLQKVGSRAITYTDGLHEAKNDDGESYGIERLKKIIVESREYLPEDAQILILGDVFFWIKGGKERLFKGTHCACQTKDDISVAIVDIKSA